MTSSNERTARFLVQVDIEDGRPQWTDYETAETLDEARKILRDAQDEPTIVAAYIWQETERDSYVPDAAGDPIAFWTRELLAEEEARVLDAVHKLVEQDARETDAKLAARREAKRLASQRCRARKAQREN